MYILFIIVRPLSEVFELQSARNVNTDIFIIQQVFWFISALLSILSYKGTHKSIVLCVFAWISILISVLATASIPYSIGVADPKIDYTDLGTMWDTMLQNLTSVWPTIQYTMLFLTAFAYGVQRASISIPQILIRIGFKKPNEIEKLSFLEEFGVAGFVSGYLIAQRWAFIDPMVPLYLVIWKSVVLLKLLKYKYITHLNYGIKTIIVFAICIKLVVVYGFVELAAFFWLNFTTYIVPLLLTIFSSLLIMSMTTLLTEFMFITLYLHNYSDQALITSEDSEFSIV